MLALTSEDTVVLKSLAHECSREGEEGETLKILVDGFSFYGEEALAKLEGEYASKEEFFRGKYAVLIENIGFAGHTFEQALLSNTGRNWLCQLVRGEGVPTSDIEDVVQEISQKIWKARWVERYNPLISSWRNFLLVPIRRYVNTYKMRKNKKVTTRAISLDKDEERDSFGGTLASRLYDIEEDVSPESGLIEQEVIEDWVTYLESQKPIKVTVRRDFEKMCTLLPPGVPDIPVLPGEERNIFFLQGGHYNSRVTTHELYADGITLMVSNRLLVNYITTDPVNREPCVDEVTGEFITQKDFPNFNYDPSVIFEEQRTWLGLYYMLMNGLQVEEIAREWRMAPPSVPARIQKLESMFRGFWVVSLKVPRSSKILAAKTYRCTACHRLDIVKHDECRVCGTDMKTEVAEVRFNTYPWPKAYVTREAYERLGNRRQPLSVQRGSISAGF